MNKENSNMEPQPHKEAPEDNFLVEKKPVHNNLMPKGELLTFGDVAKPATNLQGNFARFRKAKAEEIKYRNYVAKQTKPNERNQEFKDRLRAKFLETVKKYFGVPYAKRYWKPGEEHYDAPLFLDCCALVRQAVYDLRDEFGF